MKELTIEEKAKAYDELFVKAKQIYNKENDVLILHTIEDLFTELKESEDEKVRNELVDFVKSIIAVYPQCERFLAWLEKQREQKSVSWSEKDERCLTNAIYACMEVSDEDYDYSQSYIDAINWLKSLKQKYTWKPSDEQLYFLHWLAINVLTDGEVDKKASEVLESLYNDLKKLKV